MVLNPCYLFSKLDKIIYAFGGIIYPIFLIVPISSFILIETLKSESSHTESESESPRSSNGIFVSYLKRFCCSTLSSRIKNLRRVFRLKRRPENIYVPRQNARAVEQELIVNILTILNLSWIRGLNFNFTRCFAYQNINIIVRKRHWTMNMWQKP